MISYGEVIRICRKTAGLTQEELAKRIYVTKALIASYETGRIIPKVDRFDEILDACGYELGIKQKKTVYTAEDVVKLMEAKE